ncbi:MAG: acetate--CoA ligase family protein [Hyphomicrobiales bacterium]|nr:acetate--CoA ligase family protein [Hyphomicrobiales bacterium]MCP5373746.1 acetate--CoA ligase family protein [Hyphomicrobiales bacterium]
MNFEEHAAKPLLRAAGIATPAGEVAADPDAAAQIAARIGPCVVKAQVPTGKRGKAGGIALAATADEAAAAAGRILGMAIGSYTVGKVLVEAQVPIAREFYAAVLNDPATKDALVLFSPEGGMDIEEIAASHPDRLMRLPVDVRRGFDPAAARAALAALGDLPMDGLVDVLGRLFDAYMAHDAELLEINPLVETADGTLMALDCKFTLDDSAIKRQADLAAQGTPDRLTGLEGKAQELGLKFIELDGDVGILANGAGLTMTSMDAITHYGGRPGNFLEIGGEAYSLSRQALELVLSNPRIKSLLVNFCGAFARTDVMTAGIVEAWEAVKPTVPVFFTIHGTGEDEAVQMVRERLGLEPFDIMDDAVKAAVEAAR